MLVDRKAFFAAITPVPLPRPRKQSQVKTLDAILDECERRNITDLRIPAYIMATALRETGINLAPVREGGFNKSLAEWTDAKARAYVKRNGYAYAIVINGLVYYGRGLIQVTWLRNYLRLTELARKQGYDVDFVANPDLLLEFKWAVWAMFEGMLLGIFTGKKLSDYFNANSLPNAWVQSRRIVNGLDHAEEIATNAKAFYVDLLTAKEALNV